ncbi:glycosyltransferase family 4 protein [Geminicoccaceae bacterium 1502E]|nr:glycosyltransferase family 4 protein [Geminicoccaceae bacterium 1502E]
MSGARLVFAVPGDPLQRTGGYIYDRRVAAELGARGWRVEALRLPDGFPLPDGAAMVEAERAFAGLEQGSLVLVDGLAWGALPEVAEAHGAVLRIVALVHHPLALEAGLPPGAAGHLRSAERRALAVARRVIATSETTAETLAQDYGVPVERLAVAPPGVDAMPEAKGSGPGRALQILAVGSVIPRKDFTALVRALAGLRRLPWKLTIAGSLERSEAAVADLFITIAETGLADRVELAGELSPRALAAAWRGADLFVSASSHEGYGMALAEAVASGLPVVAVDGGAVGSWLPDDAAILVPPHRPQALERALLAALEDAPLRRRMREGALAARARLPSWKETGRLIELALLRALEDELAEEPPSGDAWSAPRSARGE